MHLGTKGLLVSMSHRQLDQQAQEPLSPPVVTSWPPSNMLSSDESTTTASAETPFKVNRRRKRPRPEKNHRSIARNENKHHGFLCYLFLVSCIASVTQSWSPSPFVNLMNNPRTSIPKGLLYSQHEGEFSDLKIIQSIKQAKTAQDIRDVLLGARREPSAINSDPSPPLIGETADDPRIDVYTLDGDEEDQMHQSEFENLSLNVTAAALRRLSHVSLQESRRKESDERLIKYRRELLAKLLENVGGKIVQTHRTAEDDEPRLLDITALADILEALSVLSQPRLGKESHMKPLARLVIGLILHHDEKSLYHLGPIRLVQCLQSLVALKTGDENENELKSRIFNRLLKPDAVSKLNPSALSYALVTLGACAKAGPDNLEAFDLSKSFMRRLRKQKVRAEAKVDDLCRSLVGANAVTESANFMTDEDAPVFQEEASIFGFTTIKAILELTSDESTLRDAQILDILSSWNGLRRYSTGDDSELLNTLFAICERDETMQKCSIAELQKFVDLLENLQPINSGALMHQSGKRFLELVEQEPDLRAIHPRTANSILRCPVLLHRTNPKIIDPFVHASTHLFTDEKFLANARLGELANFLWFMSMSHSVDQDALMSLSRRILEFDLATSCSTKLACRILSSFTSVAALQYSYNKGSIANEFGGANEVEDVSSKLFHELGGHLLSAQMSPAEISSALSAYAKSSYMLDMGIYDHLVAQLASKASDCSTRQLAQSLWACGKMVSFEGCGMGGDESDNENIDPPYLGNAKEIASVLAERMKDLSPRDITQTTWAIGRMCITDARLVCSFAFRAKQLSAKFNSAEVANIVWGLSKVGFDDREVILTLTDRLVVGDLRPKPQEISNVMYALGTLNIRDERLFSELSDMMLENIDETSAQSIANALWAHRALNIKPPKTLLNSWAVQKIGVIGIESIQF